MKKLLTIFIIIIVILIGGIGYLLFSVGAMKAEIRVIELEKQVIINSRNIQDIINFINQNTQK